MKWAMSIGAFGQPTGITSGYEDSNIYRAVYGTETSPTCDASAFRFSDLGCNRQ